MCIRTIRINLWLRTCGLLSSSSSAIFGLSGTKLEQQQTQRCDWPENNVTAQMCNDWRKPPTPISANYSADESNGFTV